MLRNGKTERIGPPHFTGQAQAAMDRTQNKRKHPHRQSKATKQAEVFAESVHNDTPENGYFQYSRPNVECFDADQIWGKLTG
ncbi:hypothetical protein [Pseudogulbenkiania subflava]|uniref:Uncharacterized protein n=1 Tax=Pseudogulbenkiania subflava DSM 22618 TaxID=1123014 RepID=A0A1Y6BDG8_9NEIS|nr:hypothetical protein [Pseudogulbenkiania subflava]SMF03478.1 hypothetical protein SAMN02745746_00882 [Pseudogulbenkiania subflava DSM 22618]